MIVGIILLVVLVTVFITVYLLNQKTPVPKGCESLKESGCNGCSLSASCSLRKPEKETIEEEKE